MLQDALTEVDMELIVARGRQRSSVKRASFMFVLHFAMIPLIFLSFSSTSGTPLLLMREMELGVVIGLGGILLAWLFGLAGAMCLLASAWQGRKAKVLVSRRRSLQARVRRHDDEVCCGFDVEA